MYNKLQKLELDYYNRKRIGDIMARLTGDVGAIRHFIAWVIYNILENLIILIFAIVTMFFINIQFTLLIIKLTPVVGLFAYRMTKKSNPIFCHKRTIFKTQYICPSEYKW